MEELDDSHRVSSRKLRQMDHLIQAPYPYYLRNLVHDCLNYA
jgi:hypothetical protein